MADNMAGEQARLAVDTRAFPLLIYDPRAGDTIRKRLSLQGNPAMKDDWFTNPKTGEVVDFIDFARSEGRFAKHFDKDGNPSETLLVRQAGSPRELAPAAGAGGVAVRDPQLRHRLVGGQVYVNRRRSGFLTPVISQFRRIFWR